MKIEELERQISLLNSSTEKMILEAKIEMLSTSLNSVITLFGLLIGIATLTVSLLVIWLNRSVNKKLEEVEEIHKEVCRKEEEILKIENKIHGHLIKSEVMKSKIDNVLDLHGKIVTTEIISKSNVIYTEVYQLINNRVNFIYNEIFICDKLLDEINLNKNNIEHNRERVEDSINRYKEFRNSFLTMDELIWDFEEFCSIYYNEIENQQLKEIIISKKFEEINEKYYYASSYANTFNDILNFIKRSTSHLEGNKR